MTIRHAGLRAARNALRVVDTAVAEFPLFLCPRFASISQAQTHVSRTSNIAIRSQKRYFRHDPRAQYSSISTGATSSAARLPLQCPGCGAFTQTIKENEAGYYTLTRRTVRKYLEGEQDTKPSAEDEIVKAALQNVDEKTAKALGPAEAATPITPSIQTENELPTCDRCHKLQHHETGVPIIHPSIDSIQETIFESPHKYNHIYHVIDAADFPMSILPVFHKLLNLTPQRSLNRRSKSGRFYQDKKTDVSFIITRSDLLAPLETQVNGMMPYLVSVLRDALGRNAADVRLGNVRCVSAIRGWWTKELKEDIWERGGGGWMVGKVNVGKSQLFRDVFPKGRRGQGLKLPATSAVQDQMPVPPGDTMTALDNAAIVSEEQSSSYGESEDFDPESLLPPPRPENDYPHMPLVSSLPGTTASPLRVPFGFSKGELIDLPGLARSSLETHVQPIHRPSLVMKSRIRPEQQSIKPGQSLLLGGFIRLTPVTPDLVFLAYAFTPIKAHLTATEKAIGIQEQSSQSNVASIAVEGTGEKIKSAGVYELKWDVTKERTGPLMRKDALGLSAEQLPFKVMAIDILVEGVGWVEVVAQVKKTQEERRRDEELQQGRRKGAESLSWPGADSKPDAKAPSDSVSVSESDARKEEETTSFSPESSTLHQGIEKSTSPYPEIEVFTPEGKYIASRRPMNAWLHIASKPDAKKGRGRPRKSMKGVKKLEKAGRVRSQS